ncbi:MAG: hypothetical protein ACO26U_09095 [Burkholderiaceae bacterium]
MTTQTGKIALMAWVLTSILWASIAFADKAGPMPRGEVVFGAMGDVPYSDRDEMHVGWVLQDMKQIGAGFAIHVGDLKGGIEPCSDTLLARRLGLLAEGPLPVVFTPGDNEWTDCHRRAAGGYDPRERLATLRRLAWPSLTTPAGSIRSGVAQRDVLRTERQQGWPENARWASGGLHFITLHVVGSRNGLGQYPDSDAEMTARMHANALWLDESVDQALRARASGLVIAFHADPDFGTRPGRGFEGFQRLLQRTAERFSKPILLVHGDGHQFRVDQPLPGPFGEDDRWEHVTRLEVFGWPRSRHWVLVSFDPDRRPAFRIMTREAAAPR